MSKISVLVSFAMRDMIKKKGLLALIVISMGVAFTAMIITSSVFEGFNNMLREGEIGWLGHIVIRPQKGQLGISNIDRVKSELDNIREIQSYSVRSYGIVAIKYGNAFYQPYKTMGVDSAEEHTSSLKNRVIEGNFVSELRPNEILIGKLMAQSLEGNPYGKNRVAVGTKVELVNQLGISQPYTVVGIIDGKTFIPNWLIILNKSELEKIDNSQINSEIAIKLNNINDIVKVKKMLEDKNLAVNIYSWKEQAGYVDDIIAGVSFITNLINGLVVATVFVLVSIIIFINILQKKRQIGILKSMGLSNLFVISVYIFETFVYVFLSCIIGFAIFYCAHLYSNRFPISMLIGDFHTILTTDMLVKSIVTMFIASVAGTLIPAFIAAKIKIIDVIRDSV